TEPPTSEFPATSRGTELPTSEFPAVPQFLGGMFEPFRRFTPLRFNNSAEIEKLRTTARNSDNFVFNRTTTELLRSPTARSFLQESITSLEPDTTTEHVTTLEPDTTTEHVTTAELVSSTTEKSLVQESILDESPLQVPLLQESNTALEPDTTT